MNFMLIVQILLPVLLAGVLIGLRGKGPTFKMPAAPKINTFAGIAVRLVVLLLLIPLLYISTGLYKGDDAQHVTTKLVSFFITAVIVLLFLKIKHNKES